MAAPVRVGINGFGRMGRLGARLGWQQSGYELVRVNETATDAAGAAHLLAFDSVQGRWDHATRGAGEQIWIDDQPLAFTSNVAISDTDWSDCDLVIEATGVHHKIPDSLNQYFAQGVRKVVVAAPTQGALNIVFGVNDHLFDTAQHHVVTASSCTTNCLAPIIQVMQQHVGIKHGSMTTIHALTNTQTLVDRGHKDLRRARAAGQSLIPTTTGSARAIIDIFPELAGKLDGSAVRVPLLGASLTDFVFEAARDVTVDEINGYLQAAADGELQGILGYESLPLVSADYIGDPRSAIIDSLSTLVINARQVKLYAWYDNEWGYVNRMMSLVNKVASCLRAV
jgi:glyceraldehyde 3-phosphate dehydrogenase